MNVYGKDCKGAHTHSLKHARAPTNTHTHTHTHLHSLIHTLTHARARTHVHIQGVHTHIRKRTYAQYTQ